MSLFGNKSSSSNSLFGGDASKKVSAPHKFDWGAAALSFMGVDPQLFIQHRRAKDEAAQQAQVAAIIDADPNLSPQDKAYAKLNPKAYLDNYMQRFQPRQFGAGGGSLGIPDASGHLSYQTAPRFDDNGTIYGPGNGASPPPILQRGTKAIPTQPGGQVQIVDALSGQPVMQGGGASPPAGVPMVSGPSPEAAAYLRQHPELAPAFDAKYGTGASRSILGQGGASPSNGSTTFPSLPR